MATPKEMVDERLAELGMSKTDFSRALGYSSYQGYYDLFSAGRTALTDEKLERIAEILGWPKDHFKNPSQTLEREEYVRKTFQRYMRTEVAQARDPDTNKILESMRWNGKFLPTVDLFTVVALAMEGKYSPLQLSDALRLAKEDHDSTVAAVHSEASADELHAKKQQKRKR